MIQCFNLLCAEIRELFVMYLTADYDGFIFPRGNSHKKESRGYRSEILKRTPKRYQVPILWVWLDILNTPKILKKLKSDFLRASRIGRHSRKIDFFFLFRQNIPLGELIQGKIV